MPARTLTGALALLFALSLGASDAVAQAAEHVDADARATAADPAATEASAEAQRPAGPRQPEPLFGELRLIPGGTVVDAADHDADLLDALQARDRRGIPLIVAGSALFVAGAIIGGDSGTIMMVAGAAIGAYGLYLYF